MGKETAVLLLETHETKKTALLSLTLLLFPVSGTDE